VKPKPSTGFEVERIPLAMASARRWLNWKPVERDGKWTKVPCDARGANVDATKPDNGRSFDDVRDAATADHGLGIGFMLGDGWLGVDLDGVVDAESGRIVDPGVEEWLASHSTYVETTPSKTGLHAIFRGVKLPAWSQSRRDGTPAEVYADKRFFTVTGWGRYVDRDAEADQAAVDAACDRWLRRDAPKPPKPTGGGERARDDSREDFKLVCKLLREGRTREEAGTKLREKMIAEGRGEKESRPDYVDLTLDKAENAIAADPGDKPSRADQLLGIVESGFRLGVDRNGEPFAVEVEGANLARWLSGTARDLAEIVAARYHDDFGKVPGGSAIADALGVLAGRARKCAPETVAIRVGEHGSSIVLDLGTPDGAAVVVDADGWRVEARSPIVFERSKLTGALPVPVRGGSVDELRRVVNVDDESWALLVGWIVAGFFPSIAHPVLLAGGAENSGKTTAARLACSVFNPSGARVQSQPRDEDRWAMILANAWSVLIDNVSKIPPWWSDSLCKAVTGDGFTKRALYSDRGLAVFNFRRVIALTSIETGALRGDLGTRLLLVDFQSLSNPREEGVIDAIFEEAHPRILGAFLDLVSGVLARRDTVVVDKLPRLADFGKLLASLDVMRGTDSLARFIRQRERIAGDVVDADPVGSAISEWLTATSGTVHTLNMKELRRELLDHDAELASRLPTTPKGLQVALARLASALRLQGFEVDPPRPTDKLRKWRLTTARTAQPPEIGADGHGNAESAWAVPF
jgi:hypothetical protein